MNYSQVFLDLSFSLTLKWNILSDLFGRTWKDEEFSLSSPLTMTHTSYDEEIWAAQSINVNFSVALKLHWVHNADETSLDILWIFSNLQGRKLLAYRTRFNLSSNWSPHVSQCDCWVFFLCYLLLKLGLCVEVASAWINNNLILFVL